MTKRLTTPNEILQAALDKEMQARDFYAELERNCSVDFVKELLLTLANEGETWGQTYGRHGDRHIVTASSKSCPSCQNHSPLATVCLSLCHEVMCNCMSVPLSWGHKVDCSPSHPVTQSSCQHPVHFTFAFPCALCVYWLYEFSNPSLVTCC
jgi:hypothetical protein